MKTSEEIAKIAWATISLGNIARPANADEVVREMAPVLAEWQREIVEACAHEAEGWATSAAHMSIKPGSREEYTIRADEGQQIAAAIRALLPVRP